MPIRDGHQQLHPAGGYPNAHPDHDQIQSHRATLHPDQAGALGTQAAHYLDDSVNIRRAVNSQLIDRQLVRTGATTEPTEPMHIKTTPLASPVHASTALQWLKMETRKSLLHTELKSGKMPFLIFELFA